MTITRIKLALLIPLMGLFACKTNVEKDNSTQHVDNSYADSIVAWQNQRKATLKADDGWLNLAGLYWLNEGENTVGSGKPNDIEFPEGKADAQLGTYTLRDGTVFFTAAKDRSVILKGSDSRVGTIKIHPSDSNIVLTHKRLEWFLIKRGNQFGIRLRDLDSELAKSFNGTENFKVDPKWRVRAKFEPSPSRTISIVNVLDQTSEENSPGTLHFSLEGKKYQLEALEGGKQLFIVFGDLTNGEQTYGSGRFLYADGPDSEGHTWLDFNKAHNPPCAFTPYSTCPLPPRQNILPVAITAGEKSFE